MVPRRPPDKQQGRHPCRWRCGIFTPRDSLIPRHLRGSVGLHGTDGIAYGDSGARQRDSAAILGGRARHYRGLTGAGKGIHGLGKWTSNGSSRTRRGPLYQHLGEALSGVSTIRAYGA